MSYWSPAYNNIFSRDFKFTLTVYTGLSSFCSVLVLRPMLAVLGFGHGEHPNSRSYISTPVTTDARQMSPKFNSLKQ